jgi:uncharacterized membrane protein
MIPHLTTIGQGDGSGIAEPCRAIVRDPAEWRALWAAHAGPESEAPVVDFGSHMVAAAFAGERPTPGFRIEIAAPRSDGSALTLVVTERAPAPGMAAAQMIVTPFHIVVLPRHDGDVRFEALSEPAQPRAAGRRAPSPTFPPSPTSPPAAMSPPSPGSPLSARIASPHAPSSTGLAPNAAAALAYLAGPFSGILILLVERANADVRFHAWQAVVGLGGLGALAVLALVSSFLTLLLSPRLFTVMYWLSGLVACVWLIVWAVFLFQAFTGRRWRMPIAGRYAERRAAKA